MTTVVTSENLAEFNASRMTDPFAAAENEAVALEAKAKEEKAAQAAQTAQMAREEAEVEIDREEAEKGEDKPEEPKKRGKLITRFSELTSKARAAEERATAAEAKLAEIEGKKPKDADKPVPEAKDYTDFDDYTDAVADWKADKKLAEREASDRKAKEEAQAGEVMKAWNTRIESAKERYPDFHEIVTSAATEYQPVIRKILIESDFGPDVLYHLSNDDKDAAKFSKMNVDQQIKFIGRLEGRFETDLEIEKDEAEEPKKLEIVKPKPKAPEPTKPIRASAATSHHVDSSGEFTGSFSQYEANRRAGKI